MLPLPLTLAQAAHEAAGEAAASAVLHAPPGLAAYAWLIPLLTVGSFLLIAAVGRRMWEGGAAIALAGVGGAMVLSFLTVLEVLRAPEGSLPYIQQMPWLEVGGFHFDVGFYLDQLTAIMLFVVSLLCFCIVLYSTSYMHGEPGVRRYFAEITLFITGMLGLVLANDFLLLFIFWEIMGLCSYLLIGFWYEKPEAAAAAKKAFLVTRVGDLFFFLGLVIMAVTFGTTNMRDVFAAAPQHVSELTAICLLFFGGAMGKSAQFPLHVWLPDAMEGPTTVSALIHAATMVKAGVYLVARAYPLFVLAPVALTFVAVIGGFTAFFAASMALVAYDIKRVLAYSTISQLAYMFLGLGVGAVGVAGYAGYSAGVLHQTSHAFTKAQLFLGARSVIHAVHSNDMRHMGGLRKYMPITSMAMLVGALSMAGFPLLSIFWSKDAVLEAAWHAGGTDQLFLVLFVLGLLTAFMTAFYMFRLWFMTFWGDYRGAPQASPGSAAGAHAPARATATAGHSGHGDHEEESQGSASHGAHDAGHHATPHESPIRMTGVLAFLAIFAALWGIAAMVLGFHGFIFFHEPETVSLGAALAHPVTVMSIVVGLAGIALAYYRYAGKPYVVSEHGQPHSLRTILEQRYYMDHAYLWVSGKAYVALAHGIDWFDRNVLDAIVNGLAWVNLQTSDVSRRLQSGNVQDYAGAILVGLLVVVMIAFYLLNPLSALHRALFPAFFGGA